MKDHVMKRVIFASCLVGSALAAPTMAGPAPPEFAASGVVWQLPAGAAHSTLRLSHPDGTVTTHEFPGRVEPRLGSTIDGLVLADGLYTYEITFAPNPRPRSRGVAEFENDQYASGAAPLDGVSGHFRIDGGAFVVDLPEGAGR